MTDTKKWTRAQVAEQPAKDTVFIIDNVVYDVSAFLDEHPGGHEVLVNVRGRDASEDFDDVGHSLDAKELMRKYVVGELVDADRVELNKRSVSWEDAPGTSDAGFLASWKFPVAVGLLLTLLYSYVFG